MINMIVSKDFYFESGHRIPGHEKCGCIHGHSYRLRIVCEGSVKDNGMVIDFSVIKKTVQESVVDKLDHKYLNDVAGLELPTAELMCAWIVDKLQGKLPLKAVRVWETKDSYAELQL